MAGYKWHTTEEYLQALKNHLFAKGYRQEQIEGFTFNTLHRKNLIILTYHCPMAGSSAVYDLDRITKEIVEVTELL